MLGSTPRPPHIHVSVVGISHIDRIELSRCQEAHKYEAVDGQSMRKASNHVERRT